MARPLYLGTDVLQRARDLEFRLGYVLPCAARHDLGNNRRGYLVSLGKVSALRSRRMFGAYCPYGFIGQLGALDLHASQRRFPMSAFCCHVGVVDSETCLEQMSATGEGLSVYFVRPDTIGLDAQAIVARVTNRVVGGQSLSSSQHPRIPVGQCPGAIDGDGAVSVRPRFSLPDDTSVFLNSGTVLKPLLGWRSTSRRKPRQATRRSAEIKAGFAKFGWASAHCGRTRSATESQVLRGLARDEGASASVAAQAPLPLIKAALRDPVKRRTHIASADDRTRAGQLAIIDLHRAYPSVSSPGRYNDAGAYCVNYTAPAHVTSGRRAA